MWQKTSKYKRPVPNPHKPKTANGQSDPAGFTPWDFSEGDFTQTGPGEMYDSEEDEVETCKPVYLLLSYSLLLLYFIVIKYMILKLFLFFSAEED